MARLGTAGRQFWRGDRVRRVSLVMAATLTASLGTGLAFAAAAPGPQAPPIPATHGVPSVIPVHGHPANVPNAAAHSATPAAVSWPAATTASIPLATPPASSTKANVALAAPAHAPNSPAWVQPVAQNTAHLNTAAPSTGLTSVQLAVADHQTAAKAGVAGVILTATPNAGATGQVRVGLDYAAFADAYGGNYASRLHLAVLPACALTTPQVPACRTQKPLASANDAKTRSVSAVVTLVAQAGNAQHAASQAVPAGAMVLAATAADSTSSSGGGSATATTLKPSGSWTAGGSSGSFTYNYPITVPPAMSSLVPEVSLSYDSGRVDGQTASTQAQSSWIGDGWSGPESYIEQSFMSCSDSPEGSASPSSTSDACYAGPVLTLSLNGSAMPLVYDATQNVYRPAGDDGQVVTHVTNSNNGTGTYNTDYWTITQRDGTVYQFGRNQLPGWTSSNATTNSVDSEPVFSAHSGDPCYNSAGFASSVCTMAYRWNLDYVSDVHHNAMAYYYKQDTNAYAENNNTTTATGYVRDSHLDHIDYGFTDGSAYSASAPDQVTFGIGDRCVSGTCDPLSSNATNWPDVPYDLNCTAGAACNATSPSHWSTVRLTGIATQQWNVAAGKYLPVDSWALSQTMPATGDGTSPTLWLSSITHTGADTTAGGSSTSITLPSVSFAAMQLPNRVDTATDGLPPLVRYRIGAVTSETGATTGVTYSPASDCTAPITVAPSANTGRCYPISWTPTGYTAPITDWFHKYVVLAVKQTDNTGGMPNMLTSYNYVGNGAWHFDDNEVVEPQYRSYGQWRGYGEVQVRTGQGADPLTLSDTTYYRGMDGDQLPSGTRSVTLTDSQGGQHTDTGQLAGNTLEATAYLGDGGPIDHSTINSYWVSAPTATRNRSGLPALTATRTGQVESWSRQALTDGGNTTWRTTETDSSYDPSTGLLAYTDTHGDLGQPTQATCTATRYVPANTGLNLVGLPAEVEVDAGNCGGNSPNGASSPGAGQINALTAPSGLSLPNDLISDTRTFYDNPTLAQTWPQPASSAWPQAAPTVGDVSVVQQANGYANGAFSYQTSKATVYDGFGHPTAVFDANGNKTATSYTLTGGLLTGATVTNALGQSASTTIDPTRGLTVSSTDANNITTLQQYDALGRLTGVWGFNRPTSQPASESFAYQVSATAPSVVTTNVLNDGSGYKTSYAIYDSLLRPLQTQTPTPQAGRMLTNTFYDSRGWVSKKYNAYWDPNNYPSGSLVTEPDNLILNDDHYTLDGLGRTVVDTSMRDSATISTATAVYNGDRTTVIPPTGGVTTSTVTDGLGRTTELDQYTAAPTLNTPANTFTGVYSVTGGTTQATTYTFNHQGRPYQIIDPSGDTWSSNYNVLGQVKSKVDPDTGTSAITYDLAGNIATTTDGNNHTLSYSYDALNRKTAEYDGPTSSAPKLASWTYDGAGASPALTYAIGKETSSSAYVTSGGTTYAYTEAATGFNVFGESLGTTVTIPSNEGALAGSYTFKHTFTPTVGLPQRDLLPASGGLPQELTGYSYTSALDLPSGLGSNIGAYASQSNYDAFGHVTQEEIGPGPNFAWITNTYDDHTGRLTDASTTRTATPVLVDDTSYGYDLSGNIISETDNRANTATETQCYGYDTLDRLAQAWTATDSCKADPSTNNGSTVGDAINGGAYWTSWSFDPLGDRTSEVDHGLAGAANTTTTYTYPTPGANAVQPHGMTSTSTTGPNGTSSTGYQYDSAGNTTQRVLPSGTQTLTWTDTGKLNTISSNAGPGTTAYTYDADGSELLRHDPGTTTLFLPGEELAMNTSTNAVTGTRFYPMPGGGQVVRTTSGYTYEITDQQGTASLQLDTTAQNPTWRQFTPYGAPRGTTPTNWPDQHGFLNKPTDTSTGLTDVGARQYDPVNGKFISVDPVLSASNPQSMTGYSYANDNPTTESDPTGLDPAYGDCGQADTAACENYYYTGTIQTDASHPWSGGGTPDYVNIGVLKYHHWNWHDANQDPHFNQKAYPHYVAHGQEHPGSGWDILAGLASALLGTLDSINPACSGEGVCLDQPFMQWATSKGIDPTSDGFQFGQQLPMAASLFVPGGEIADGAFAAEAGAGEAIEGDAAGAVGRACVNSFSGQTQVLMADGTTKPIDKVVVGDKVTNAIPGALPGGADQQHLVTAVHVTYTDVAYTDVTVNSKNGPATITGTAHHLYWDATTRTWTEADQLRIGDRLQTSNGATITITALHDYTTTMVTYNLTVNNLHTYYVEAGGSPILVHNCDGVGEESPRFIFHSRVDDQLEDPRLGPLRGQLSKDDLQQYAVDPNALFVYDARTDNINIIQDIDGRLIRISVANDKNMIISVGPIKPNSVRNSIANGNFIVLGGGE